MSASSRSLMEKTWLATPDSASLTGWPSGYIRRFIQELGTDFDSLFSVHAARFVANERRFPRGMDWAVVTLRAERVLVRFVRDRGDVRVFVAGAESHSGFLSIQDVYLATLHDEIGPGSTSSPGRVAIPSEGGMLRDRFDAISRALSPLDFEKTSERIASIRSMRAQGAMDLAYPREDSGFLSNYGRISDEIGSVPFWKPLGTSLGTVLLFPFVLLAGAGIAVWLLLKSAGRSLRPPVAR